VPAEMPLLGERLVSFEGEVLERGARVGGCVGCTGRLDRRGRVRARERVVVSAVQVLLLQLPSPLSSSSSSRRGVFSVEATRTTSSTTTTLSASAFFSVSSRDASLVAGERRRASFITIIFFRLIL